MTQVDAFWPKRALRTLAVMACSCLVGCFGAPKNEVESLHQQDGALQVEDQFDRESLLRTDGPQGLNVDSSRNPSSGPNPNVALVLLALTAMLAAIGSISLSGYLFLWRRRLPDGQISLLPERVISLVQQLAEANMRYTKAAVGQQEQSLQNFEEVQKSFEIFGALIAEKDKQIERLRQGSDKQVYLQFLKRFIRVVNFLDSDILEDQSLGKDTKSLRGLRGYLVDALLDTGLEEFAPPTGADYRSTPGVADKPDVIEVQDLSQDWKISATVRPGFQILTADLPMIIEPARVQIYRYKARGN